MNILQIHNFYIFKGGEDEVVLAEKQMLEQKGHNVISLTIHNEVMNSYFSKKKEFYEVLMNIIVSQKIDVAHIHNVYHIIGNNIYKTLATYNIPIVQTLHNFRFLCPSGLFLDNQNNVCERCINGNVTSCVLKKCYQKSYIKSLGMALLANKGRKVVNNYVDEFIALNSFSKNKFVESGFKEENISVKSNFLKIEKKEFVNTYSYFLYVGRLSPEKGIETLIKAFAQSNLPLKIAGSGTEIYVEELKKLAKNNKNIEFIGFVSGQAKEKIFQNAISLIIPSNCYENFPISILEAYGLRKPVICSNIGGLPSIVKNGVTGLLFESGSSDSLLQAVNAITENNQFEVFGQNGYDYFLNNFTEEYNYQQLMAIYNSAIENREKKCKNTF
ncbi:glycosyltransferase family 4 protein [Arcicella sp. LKC2W]|uniref:glycosyltransferase family 4 protein n=1 Tax=Arcicella sp. LKC2W TaxID=2984198 RepID=UPI002B2067BE|nr:glycosyltransferase family 4 protein [Arcicella sp. LKC2W]MEA5458972.1 glycosyltransferase family 4 protein [Arcicella sp. LKC2W]